MQASSLLYVLASRKKKSLRGARSNTIQKNLCDNSNSKFQALKDHVKLKRRNLASVTKRLNTGLPLNADII